MRRTEGWLTLTASEPDQVSAEAHPPAALGSLDARGGGGGKCRLASSKPASTASRPAGLPIRPGGPGCSPVREGAVSVREQ